MRRLLAAALLVLIFATAASGQDEGTAKWVVVVDYESEAIIISDCILLAKNLAAALSEDPDFRAIPRMEIVKKLAELKKEDTAFYDDPDEAAKLGEALGADMVVVCQINRLGATYRLDGRVMGVEEPGLTAEYRLEHTGTIMDAVGLSELLAIHIAGKYEGAAIKTESLPEARVGVEYMAKLELDSEQKKEFKWSSVDGLLPAGLKIKGDYITGMPKKPGEFKFTLRASVETPKIKGGIEKILGMRVKPAALALPDRTLAVGRLGHKYEQIIAPPTGTPPFIWEKLEGDLPKGIEFDVATGKVAGVPIVSGTFRFRLRVTDSIEPPETVDGWMSLRISEGMKITSEELPTAYPGCEYFAKLEVEDGLAPLRVEVVGAPEWLDLKTAAKGLEITGRAGKEAAHGEVTVKVTDSTQPVAQEARRTFEVRVKGFHVTPVSSYSSLEIYDMATDSHGAPLILTAMNVLGKKERWVSFCRWSGKEWTILPVTAEVKGGNYMLAYGGKGATTVISYSGTGNQSQMFLSAIRQREDGWQAEYVATGKMKFLRAACRADGEPVFGYIRNGRLCILEKSGEGWKEDKLPAGAEELTIFLCDRFGTKYFLYQSDKGKPRLAIKTGSSTDIFDLPDFARCAGLDSDGNLYVFSYCLGETLCHVRGKNGLRETGRWGRITGLRAVFSPSATAAYSPISESESWEKRKPGISCVSPEYIFSDLTFKNSELEAGSLDSRSMLLAVGKDGVVHAAFKASGVPGRQKEVLVYGRISSVEDFSRIAGAKSFVRLTGQREISMPKSIPGRNDKTGGCSVEHEGSACSLLAFLLLVPLYYYRKRKLLRG